MDQQTKDKLVNLLDEHAQLSMEMLDAQSHLSNLAARRAGQKVIDKENEIIQFIEEYKKDET